MRILDSGSKQLERPILSDRTRELATYMQSLTPEQLRGVMHISASLADAVAKKYQLWNDDKANQTPAIDAFIGDIYSGLQASVLTESDREYANKHLRILSGLYGIL